MIVATPKKRQIQKRQTKRQPERNDQARNAYKG